MLKKLLAIVCVAALLCGGGITAYADFDPEMTAHIKITATNSKIPATEDARSILFPNYGNGRQFGTIQWTSNDTEIATVDEYGTVTGLKEGSCTIQAVHTNSSGVSTTKMAMVTVSYGDVNFNETNTITLKVGETVDLRAVHHPGYTTSFLYGSIKWSSENILLAHVDANGIVTALEPGTCTITSSHKDANRKINERQAVIKIVEA